ncbi:ACR077Wp [Eremothecium gossypii ATCC 10895]|uniref:ACR077Wp n=1 Tax=Eremothecium gossypii (strain ATCC 10895 / CBS 109.51 / FGSC 9923 / NRRL Y-1056) TaxID=284811 RepID=Q75C40_EREGS|nr:ACR077Wp [Eremothecium gossypii ATCC 10895]AAS51303.2 ACR077Wp [Eremothecium gossypii ATCC 10895]AEY95595.1 FACR077Wp [Eremothecium gossypii FDAG1]
MTIQKHCLGLALRRRGRPQVTRCQVPSVRYPRIMDRLTSTNLASKVGVPMAVDAENQLVAQRLVGGGTPESGDIYKVSKPAHATTRIGAIGMSESMRGGGGDSKRKTLRYVLEKQGNGPSFEAQLLLERIPDSLPPCEEFQQRLRECQDGTLLLNLATTFYQPLEDVATVKALFRFRDYFFHHQGWYSLTFNQFVRVYPVISCLMVKSKGQREKVKCPKAFVSESRCRMDTSHRSRSQRTRSKKPRLECDCKVNYRIEIDMTERMVTMLVKGLHTHPIENVLAFKTSFFLVNILDDLCKKGHKNVNQIQDIMKQRLEPYDWDNIGFTQMLATRSHFTNRIAKFHPPNGLARGFEPGTIVITHFEADKPSDERTEHDLPELVLQHGDGMLQQQLGRADPMVDTQLENEAPEEMEQLQDAIIFSLTKIGEAARNHKRNGDLQWIRKAAKKLTSIAKELDLDSSSDLLKE